MPLTRSASLRLVRVILIGLAVTLIIGYIAWRSFDYVRGPKIEILDPPDGMLLASSTVVVNGRAERIIDLTVNGDPLSMDEQGEFSRAFVAFPGINILTFSGADQFGRNVERRLTLIGPSL